MTDDQQEPADDEKVFVKGAGFGSTVLHTTPECYKLQNANKITERSRGYYPDDKEFCKDCMGDAERASSDPREAMARKLEEMQPGELEKMETGDLVTDGGEDLVFVRVNDDKGEPNVYHTDESCKMLVRSNEIDERLVTELDSEVRECKWCAGEVVTGKRTNSVAATLVEMSPDDLVTDGGQDVEHYPDGFVSAAHLRDQQEPGPAERQPACIETDCASEAMDRCGCCGRHLCSRHNETQGGFCSEFTSVETEAYGDVPACVRVLSNGDTVIDPAPHLIYPADTPAKERATEASYADLEAALDERMPEWQVEQARDLLEHAGDAMDTFDGERFGAAAGRLDRWLESHRDGEEPDLTEICRALTLVDDTLQSMDPNDILSVQEPRWAVDHLEDVVALLGGGQ